MSALAEDMAIKLGIPKGGPYPVLGQLEQPRSATVRVPLCLDLATIDSTEKFSGSQGGGGVGLAIDMHIFLRIAPADEWHVGVIPDRSVEHISRSICNLVDVDTPFRITTPGGAGVPFDSTPEIIAAAAAGVNAALGRPFGQRELRRIISNNLAQDGEDELRLRPDTGVRVAGAFFGGLVVVTDELEVACRTPMPDSGSIVLVYPDSAAEPLDKEKMVSIDSKDREKKALEILMRLMPAAIQSEIPKMGDSIYRLQLLGSKVVEIRRYEGGKNLYRLMSMMRVKGCQIVAVHDDTGIIAAFVGEDGLDNTLELIKENHREKIITRPDNKGMRITVT